MKLICLDNEGKKYERTVRFGDALCGHRVLYAQLDKSDAWEMAKILTSKSQTENLNAFLQRLTMRFQHSGVDTDEVSSGEK